MNCKDFESNIIAIENIVKDMRYYDMLQNIIRYDADKGFITKNGLIFRSELNSFVAKKRSELIDNEVTRQLYVYFSKISWKEEASDIDKALIRCFLFRCKKTYAIPVSLEMEWNSLFIKSMGLYKEAKAKNNFSIISDTLKQIFELKKQIALSIEPERPALETLINCEFEEYYTFEEVNNIMQSVKEGCLEIYKKIKSTGKEIDNVFLTSIKIEGEELRKFTDELLKFTGFDFDSGKTEIGDSHFCLPAGPLDCRVNSPFADYDSIFGQLHESGHARYGYGSSNELIKKGLWGGLEGSMHEGQARFYEQILGRSKALWTAMYPKLQEHFPKYKEISLEDFYYAVNKVDGTLERLSADEITYNLHIALRFEMEKEYYDGNINIEDLPKIWNDKMEKYLGVRPKTDLEGILQDVHWFWGAIGYYPNYLLGNVYNGQFLHQIEKDIPDVWEQIEKGKFFAMENWLITNIHQYSKLYTPKELVRKVTGEDVTPKYFIEYLEKKYKSIYNF